MAREEFSGGAARGRPWHLPYCSDGYLRDGCGASRLRESAEAGAPSAESAGIQRARGQHSRVLETLRHLRNLRAGQGDILRRAAALHQRVRQAQPGGETSVTRALNRKGYPLRLRSFWKSAASPRERPPHQTGSTRIFATYKSPGIYRLLPPPFLLLLPLFTTPTT